MSHVARRIAELLAGAGIGLLLGLLVWYFTSEAFWLWAGPVVGAFSSSWPDDRSPLLEHTEKKTWTRGEAALHEAALSARENGRISLCADEVLLSLLGHPQVAQYLQEKGIAIVRLRITYGSSARFYTISVGKARMGPLSQPARLQPRSEVLRSLWLRCPPTLRKLLVRKGAN